MSGQGAVTVKKIIKLFIVALFAALLLVACTIPLVNDSIANSVKSDLIKLPMPYDSELIDSVSSAGKLTGNGNGMQFFGAILIKSQLSLDELEDFYSQYRESEWSCLVDKQTNRYIDFIEHGKLSFKALGDLDTITGYYIVYTWGNSDYPFSDFDLRGH